MKAQDHLKIKPETAIAQNRCYALAREFKTKSK